MAKPKIAWVNHLIELVVVIIGVTIAFSLNNWNESRKTRSLETKYLQSMRTELETDIELMSSLLDTSRYYLRMNNKLLGIMYRRDYENDSSFWYVMSLYSYSEFIPTDNTFESLKASGSFEIIRDFELKKDITTLYNQYYERIALIDGFHREHSMNRISPYVNENVRFSGRPQLINTEFMRENYFVNMAHASQYLLTSKIDSYDSALVHANTLKSKLDNILGG